jgi:DHA2 family multidrug resistance protein-like MFS transporter
MATVLAIIYGIKQIAVEAGALRWALPMAAGAATFVVFVRRQRTLTDPLIDLQLFRVRAFSAALATNGLGFFVNFAALLFIAQYLQLVLGLSPWQAGLWTLPSSGGFIVGSLIVPAIVRYARPAFVMSGGLPHSCGFPHAAGAEWRFRGAVTGLSWFFWSARCSPWQRT